MNKKINSIKGLEKIKRKSDLIFVRMKGEKYGISDLNVSEFIDVLIGWIKQKRRI